MNPENPAPASSPAPAAKPAPRPRADQDQQVANDISDALELIQTAKTDADLGPLIAERGYDTEKLTAGAALQSTAQTAFNERQKAKAISDKAGGIFADAEAAARRVYAEFRETARVEFSLADDQTALGIKGKVPADLQKFITTAKASYAAAQAEPYASGIAKAGFKAAKLQCAVAAIERLPVQHADALKAAGDAQTATLARNAAHEALTEWIGKFRRLARLALKGQPGMMAKLKL